MRRARNREESTPAGLVLTYLSPLYGGGGSVVLLLESTAACRVAGSCGCSLCHSLYGVPRCHKSPCESWNMKSGKRSTLLSFQVASGHTESHFCACLAWVQPLVNFSPWTLQRSHAISFAWNTLLATLCIAESFLPSDCRIFFFLKVFSWLSRLQSVCWVLLQNAHHSQLSWLPIGLPSFFSNTE